MTSASEYRPSSGPLRGTRDPDPHGQAALLLVESLIHGLIARGALSSEDAVEIVDVAATIEVEMAQEHRERSAILAESLALLAAMSSSLERDVRR